jgi:hypothetical protein
MSSTSKITPEASDYQTELEKIIRNKRQNQNNQKDFQPEPNLLETVFQEFDSFIRNNSSSRQ